MAGSSEQNFLDPPPELADPEAAGVLVLPLPVDLTCSWQRGTAAGPAAIIDASTHIEPYDEELGLDVCAAVGGIATAAPPDLPAEPAALAEAVFEAARGLLSERRLLLSLGGEHSVTAPLVRAHAGRWAGLCVLQIDAHADMRDTYRGSPHNHACPMRRVTEAGVHVTAVGIRSVDEEERRFMDGSLHRTFLALDVVGRMESVIPEIVASLPGPSVYVTIDLDGLDPAVVPAVGTPVPGGLGWYETLALLRAVCRRKAVVGADVVELSPREGLHMAASAAARLAYKLMGYRLAGGAQPGHRPEPA